jgi:hypothetical protein
MTSDTHYTVTLEHPPGTPTPYWVARYKGEFLGSAEDRGAAVHYMLSHRGGMVAAMLAINTALGVK